MSKRIEELAALAWRFARKSQNETNDDADKYYLDFQTKFAELLIKEALEVALYGDEFMQARANVKQLFGAEE